MQTETYNHVGITSSGKGIPYNTITKITDFLLLTKTKTTADLLQQKMTLYM